jgi:predicted nuclease of predicted toxin-antitoxin system
MWLLDVNLPNGLRSVLLDLGFESHTTVHQGWRNLGNGELSKAAVTAGFRVILTRDRLFGESAAKALQMYPQLCVVILKIPQSKAESYLASFKNHWEKNPILIVSGTVIEWPSATVKA